MATAPGKPPVRIQDASLLELKGIENLPFDAAKRIQKAQQHEVLTLEKLADISKLSLGFWKSLVDRHLIELPIIVAKSGDGSNTDSMLLNRMVSALESLEKSIGDNLGQKFDNLGQKFDHLSNSVQKMDTSLGKKIDQMNDDLGRKMEHMEDSLSTIVQDLGTKLDSTVDKIGIRVERRIDALESKVCDEFSQVKDGMASFESKVDAQFYSMGQSIKSNASSVAGVSDKVSATLSKIGELEKAQEDNSSLIIALDQRVANQMELSGQMYSSSQRVESGINEVLNHNVRSINDLTSLISSRSSAERVDQGVSELQNLSTKFTGDLAKLIDSSVKKLEERVSAEVRRVEDSNVRLNKDVLSTLDASVVANTQSHNALRDATTELSYHVQNLPSYMTPHPAESVLGVIPTDSIYRRADNDGTVHLGLSRIPNQSNACSSSGSRRRSRGHKRSRRNKSKRSSSDSSSTSSSGSSTSSSSTSSSSSEDSHHRSRRSRKNSSKGPQMPKLSTFDGDPTQWRSFIFMFEIVAKNYKWSKKERLQKLTECLRGKAVDYLKSRPSKVRKTYKSLLKDLEKRFDLAAAPTVLRRQLTGTKQEETETIETFADRVYTLVSDGYPKASDKTIQTLATEVFLSGCKDKTAALLASEKNPKTISKALAYVKSSSTNTKMVGTRQFHVRQVSFPPSHTEETPKSSPDLQCTGTDPTSSDDRLLNKFVDLLHPQSSAPTDHQTNARWRDPEPNLRPNYSPRRDSYVGQYLHSDLSQSVQDGRRSDQSRPISTRNTSSYNGSPVRSQASHSSGARSPSPSTRSGLDG